MRPLFVLVVLLSAVPASAQERWAVVRSGVGDASEAERSARAAIADSLRGTGLSIRTDAEEVTRVEDYHSSAPSAVESDRIEELRAAVTALEEHAALRQREAARAEAEHIRALSEGLSSDFAEQTEVAERLFAACVAEAWLHIQLREREEARQILQQCRELHPDVAINPVTVAPPVVEMLRAIDAELSRRPTFALTCEGVPAGCELRLDGRRRAVAPEPITGIVPGAHRLELVCEGLRRRRVHRVVVGAEDRTLPFDPRFDDALLTGTVAGAPEVRLDYPTEAEERERRVADGAALGRVLEATVVVLVTREARGLRFDRLDVARGRVVASVVVDPAALEGPVVLRAASAILEGHSVDLTGREPRDIRAWPGGETDAARGDGGSVAEGGGVDAAPIVGVVLGVLGLGAYGAGWGTYSVAYDASFAQAAATLGSARWRQAGSDRDAMIAATYGLGIGGSALLTASLPLWLPQTPGEIPWWSWAIGGAGLLAVIPAAIALEGNGRRYADAAPYLRYDTGVLGAMWLSAMAPLLAVPLIYAIRLAVGPGASATVEASPEGARLSLGGTF